MSEPAIRLEHVRVCFGRVPALVDVSLEVREGEYLGVIGPNGGGKTTLLRAILGLVPVTEGEIRVCGRPPGRGRAAVGYVPQSAAIDRRFPITVGEVVLTGRISGGPRPLRRYTSADRRHTGALLERVGIAHLAGRQVAGLSGGEFQKMLIARALAAEPRILLLDEPTASVDAVSREQIYALLREMSREMTILLVTHDLLAISSHVRRLACLNGRLFYHGEPELSQSVIGALYGCPVDLIAHGVPHRVLSEHREEENV
ncbi:MAG: ABC transporter ATP-binding protein [Clostridiales bacterium]|nr:ABC transporter ATP-binding protein [Clostridiales bacterium]